jgi:hypothetical protein
MNNLIEESVFNMVTSKYPSRKTNLIKAELVEIHGNSKICFEEDDADGVKLVLMKDNEGNIKEIKFICSCGQTKALVLDYSDSE